MIFKTIKHSDNYEINENGDIFKILNSSNKRINIKWVLGGSGYYHVNLYKNGGRTTRNIHRLIAEHFIENPHNLSLVCHRNDIKTDNRIENLYWATHKENARDSIVNKKRACRSKHGRAKLTEQDVEWVREVSLYKAISNRKMAKILSVTPTAINFIVNNQTWKE